MPPGIEMEPWCVKHQLNHKCEEIDTNKPSRPLTSDGIYPRCVWCGGENYGPNVIEYSKGTIPCAAVDSCEKYLPKEYIKL